MDAKRITRAAAALAVVAAAVIVGVVSSGASATAAAPYTDANAAGYIGLCNAGGRQVTSGSIYTAPFAWRAVSSEAAPAPYDDAGRTAILLAYQPQQGLTAAEWSGDSLTASSRYSNTAHPMAAATRADDSLEDFIEEFHPRWDGFLQLRMYLGTRDAEVYSVHYPVLNIEVTGTTWRAVGGGSVDCHDGTAESLESVVLPARTTNTPQDSAGSASSSNRLTAAADPAGGSPAPFIAIGAAAVLLVGGALLVLRRRRLQHLPLSSAATGRRSLRKGSA